jgi:hypothetical protein
MVWFMVIVSLCFAVSRFVVPVAGKVNTGDIYKDMAHLWVGFVFGWAAAGNAYGWWIGGALTVLEIVAFVVRTP